MRALTGREMERQREREKHNEKMQLLKFPRANSVPIHKVKVPSEKKWWRKNVFGLKDQM